MRAEIFHYYLGALLIRYCNTRVKGPATLGPRLVCRVGASRPSSCARVRVLSREPFKSQGGPLYDQPPTDLIICVMYMYYYVMIVDNYDY